jgi:hypothetical protein
MGRRLPACSSGWTAVADGLDVEACVREALEALGTQPMRDEKTGQFIAGTLAAGKTLERSEVFWSAVADAKRELLERVRCDAPDPDAPETLRGLQDAYCEARLFRSAMFVRLVEEGGPSQGKARCERSTPRTWARSIVR